MAEKYNNKLAVLIDADNAQASMGCVQTPKSRPQYLSCVQTPIFSRGSIK